MNARSTRGPGGGRHGGRRPPVRRTSGRDTSKPGCAMVAVAAALALVSTAVILTPLAVKVWTAELVPAANRVHYGDALTPALALAGLGLYLITSVLFVRRRSYSPAGSAPVLRGAGTGRSGVPVLVEPRRPCSEDPAAGVAPPQVSTPAATTDDFDGGAR